MSSLRATVEKVRAEKAGVEEQLAEVQNLLVREQEAHRGLQEVKTHHSHHHSAIITMIDHDVQNDKNHCQVVGREREEWAGEREASAHLIQVGCCQIINISSKCQR